MKTYSPTPLAPNDLTGINQALAEDGVAVVAGILSEQEQKQFLDFFWEAISARMPALQREDPSSWVEDNTDWYGTFNAGQYKHYGMAQEKHCWLIRRNETIKRIFEEGVFASCKEGEATPTPEPCCVSLDGCAALFRPSVSGLDLHVDLVPGIDVSDWGSVQGAYNLYEVGYDEDAGKANAGFVCVVGSHKQYETMWEDRRKDPKFEWPKKNWHKLELDSPLQDQASLILSPPNSLVLWRSELLHKNYGGDFTSAELGSAQHPRLPRLTQFISFAPKKFRTEEALRRKALAVVDGCCNNHWAALSVRVPIIPFPAWSPAAKKITIKLPSFAADIDVERIVEEKDVCNQKVSSEWSASVDTNKACTGKRKRKETMKKKISNVVNNLPQYIQELL